MTGLSAFLDRCARAPDRPAIIDRRGRTLGYGALADRSAALAAAWQRRGVAKGDRVLLAMPLGPDLYVALAALWRLGAVIVFPEPAMGLAGLRHAARVTRPRAFLAAGWYRALGIVVPELWTVPLSLAMTGGPAGREPLADLRADDPALISFTSGSTGAPKGMVRTHGLLAAQNDRVAGFLRTGDAPSVDLVAFPVFVLANLALGNVSVLPDWNLRRQDRVRPRHLADQIRSVSANRALLPPSVCAALAPAVGGLALNTVFTGGGPVFPDLIARLSAAAPHTDLVAVYGSTEAEPIAHLHARDIADPDWQAMRSGAGLLAGPPVDGIRIRIVEGEIAVTGAHVNKGYLDPKHDAFTKLSLDGEIWHRTGDAGRLDGDGRLWLLGRLEARQGAIHPFAIEVAARTWPGVAQAALAGHQGRAVLAVVGDTAHLTAWSRAAAAIGDIEVLPVTDIPLDRRHRSKVDYRALQGRLARTSRRSGAARTTRNA